MTRPFKHLFIAQVASDFLSLTRSFFPTYLSILLARLHFSSITTTVSMPIEVATSPSITDTLHSYRDFSCQPSFLAKISRTAPVANWITQEQAIVMENPTTDVSVHHRCCGGRLFLFAWFFLLAEDSCHSHYWLRISAVIIKSTPCTAINRCLKACPLSKLHPFSLAHPQWTKTRHPTIPCRRIRLFLLVYDTFSPERYLLTVSQETHLGILPKISLV